jgi:hypothetical protein
MEDKEKVDLQFEYAWRWFEYHATQRLIAFRFYLIIIGAMGWLFLRESSVLLYPHNMFFGIILLVVSIFFFLLELRNNQLVNCARSALDELEKDQGLLDTPYAIREKDKKSKKCCVSHLFVIRIIYIIVASIGLIFIGMSLCT